ncbi:hypothetical protein [Parvibaculum sp.]|uniref:hypothetical protein n=1 Tax=Parvibaculum sp. TaxID=2024848 RepID=UPI00391AA1C2
MGLFSLFKGNKKLEPPPAEDAPPVTPAAMQRALRATSITKGSYNAAELGERIATALSTIETSVLAIDAIMDRLREAADLVADAGTSADDGRRALLAGRYDELREEIDAIAGSATHNRVNLIAGRRIGGKQTTFDIAFDDEARSGVAIPIVNLTTGEAGLSLSPPRDAFAPDEEVAAIAAEIEAARATAARVSDRLVDHAALISERLARLMEMAGPREIGTRLPTGADPPEEAAPAIDPAMAEVEEKLRALSERLNDREPLVRKA